MRVATTPPPTRTLYARKLATAIESAGVEVEVLTLRRLVTERFDIVHLHWPEWQLRATPYARMALRATAFLFALWWARRRGARLVWTVHNVEPHEATPPRASVAYFAVLTRLVDGVISPSAAGVDALRVSFHALRGLPTAVIPIGHLVGEYPGTATRAEAREHLGLDPDSMVALFFGLIRPYKGVEALATTFAGTDATDSVLVIAGEPTDESTAAVLRATAEADPRVRLRLGRVPDEEVAGLLDASDLVVLPYARSTNSFVALLALSHARPLLAPAIGGFPELQRRFGRDWVRLYHGALTGEVLESALHSAIDVPRAAPDLTGLDWDRIAATTIAFYERVGGSVRRSGR